MKSGVAVVLLALAGLPACHRIAPYRTTLPELTQALAPPSQELLDYTSGQGLALQLERTSLRCSVVRQALAREIDQREGRLVTTRKWLLTVGSLAAIASTIYSGIADTPEKGVVIPLGAVSGSALLSAIPSLDGDQRIDALEEQHARIREREAVVVESVNRIERELLELALLQGRRDQWDEDTDEWTVRNDSLTSAYAGVSTSEERLRTALSDLSRECD